MSHSATLLSDRVHGDTPWRETGNTGFEHFLRAISRTHPPATQSPLAAEASDLYEVLYDAGLTRFAAAMLWHEKKNDTWRDTPIPAWLHNPFSTKDRARPGEWEAFDSYTDAARAWVARISQAPYPHDGTIREFIEIYAPSIENDVERYVAVLVDGINALPLENAALDEVDGSQAFPGLPESMPAEVLRDLFPEANPRGPVTRFYIDYCTSVMPPGQWPRFNGSRELRDGSTWWDFNPLHIFSSPDGDIWVPGDPDRLSQADGRPAIFRELAWDTEDLSASSPQARDLAQKDAAVAHDLSRKLAVTLAETPLLEAPGGDVNQVLPAGTRLTILGPVENDAYPVAVPDDALMQGYVEAGMVADLVDVLAVPQALPRDRERDRDRDRDRERERKRRREREQGRPERQGESGEPGGRRRRPETSTGPVSTDGHGGRPTTAGGPGPGGGPVISSSAGAGERIAAEASRYVGRRYVWATHGPETFDCSGLVHWVVLQATNQTISADSHVQFNLGTSVPWDQLRPGDILFYDPQHGGEVRAGNRASHVGIFVREGQMVNALNEERGVLVSDPFSDYFRPLYLGARRLG